MTKFFLDPKNVKLGSKLNKKYSVLGHKKAKSKKQIKIIIKQMEKLPPNCQNRVFLHIMICEGLIFTFEPKTFSKNDFLEDSI